LKNKIKLLATTWHKNIINPRKHIIKPIKETNKSSNHLTNFNILYNERKATQINDGEKHLSFNYDI
jgi:CO dehydrogenase/acetyl-CoA synthase alpha subunit